MSQTRSDLFPRALSCRALLIRSFCSALVGLTVFVAGYGVGPLLWSPMSESEYTLSRSGVRLADRGVPPSQSLPSVATPSTSAPSPSSLLCSSLRPTRSELIARFFWWKKWLIPFSYQKHPHAARNVRSSSCSVERFELIKDSETGVSWRASSVVRRWLREAPPSRTCSPPRSSLTLSVSGAVELYRGASYRYSDRTERLTKRRSGLYLVPFSEVSYSKQTVSYCSLISFAFLLNIPARLAMDYLGPALAQRRLPRPSCLRPAGNFLRQRQSVFPLASQCRCSS